MLKEKKVPWNKGKKETIKHVYYTNGKINIRIPYNEACPDGFYRGRVIKWSEDSKKQAQKKRSQTCLERYRNPNYNNPTKNKKTCLERYGVDNVHKLSTIIEKSKETCLKKYGVDNPMKNKDIQNKVQNRTQKTCLQKYGVNSFSKTQDFIDKVKDTCLQKYGVMFSCQTEACIKSCKTSESKPNIYFNSLLEKNGIQNIEREIVIENRRYDFKIGNTLIEINPSATHNVLWGVRNKQGLDINYHFNKRLLAEKYGYHVINIYDWDNIEIIINHIEDNGSIIGARKCKTKEVSTKEARDFLNKYHFQGYTNSKYKFGLYYDNELVSLMTFGKPRYNKNYEYELLRYCSKNNIIGGVSKLWKYAIRTLKAHSIISYCDLNKFTGNMYQELGFKCLRTSIGVHWYNMKTNQHITDNLLRQRGFDQLFGTNYGKGTSNEELMIEHNFVKICDAGQATYIWSK